MQAKKSLGQNFLMHAAIAERIADSAQIAKTDTVLEIGPGTGMLTRPLLARAKKVIAIEADGELFALLQKEFADAITAKKLELIHGDIRELDFAILPRKYVVVANIPYYITGEILRSFLEAARQPSSMTLLVQKEVAVRIVRSKKESLLSLSIKAFGTPSYEFTVPSGAFRPAPKVDSAVLRIRDISRKNFKSRAEEAKFFELIHAGFAHKRKLLAGNLRTAGLPVPDMVGQSRAEDLSLAAWFALISEPNRAAV
jgi:16S rRNA (adenine1518-N6/adenine1519-N6)-dimethyltransferase